LSTRNEYEYTDLNGKPALIQEIVQLEQKLKQETGQPVTLIAYSPADADSSLATSTGRAGLNE